MAVPEGGLPLTPFIHQVGGHRGILLYDKRTICKPMFEREIRNYRYLAPIMGDFVPKFKGVVEVVVEKDKEDDITYRAITAPSLRHIDHGTINGKVSSNIELDLISSVDSKCSVTDDMYKGDVYTNHKTHVSPCCDGPCIQNNNKNSPCQRISPNPQCLDDSPTLHGPTRGKVFEDATDYSYLSRGNGLNPWSLRVHQAEALRFTMGENRPFKIHADYMLLENVTVDYQCPSVIDLKIGTRCHGDDLSEEKKQLNIARALESTTKKLGVRFGGMQVYQADKGTYVCCNKKYGNKLTEDDLRYEVGRFVYDKHRHSRRIRASIIRRISQLKELISSMDQYRFFGCSVLIIYEGMEKVDSTTQGNDVNGSADVESTLSKGDAGSGKYRPDCNDEPRDLRTENAKRTDEGDDEDDDNDGVLVKIIDFAHSSSAEVAGMDGINYEGEDKGFVYGLETLIELIREGPAKT